MRVPREPSTWRHEYLDHAPPIAFAHRGGIGRHVENTMASFAEAVDLGYRYLETDVHATRDGGLVAFHDADLTRIAGVGAMIGEMTTREVDAVGIRGERGRSYRIPTLDELLVTWPDARFNIDPKADDAVAPLIASLRSHAAIGRVCIGSFSDARIAECRSALGRDLCTSMGPRAIGRLRLASYGVSTGRFFDGCVQLPPMWKGRRLVDRRLLGTAHRLGLAVHVWTINDMHEAQRLIDLGVDGIMTDETRAMREVFLANGLWPTG